MVIKVYVRLEGNYGITHETIILNDGDIMEAAKQKALSLFDENWYNEADPKQIESIEI